jgi:hypothetical protein
MLRQSCDPKGFMFLTPPAPKRYGRWPDIVSVHYQWAGKTGVSCPLLFRSPRFAQIERKPAHTNTSKIAIISAKKYGANLARPPRKSFRLSA